MRSSRRGPDAHAGGSSGPARSTPASARAGDDGRAAPANAAKAATRRDAGRKRGSPIVDAVLRRTLEDLAAHGIAGLSVDRIARAADVHKTSIYRRFPTRDALVAAALARVHDDLGAAIVDTGTLRGDLRVMTRAIAAFLDGDEGRALARAVFSGPVAPDVGALARARLAERAALPVVGLVARAVDRGEWRDGVDPAVVLAALVGGLLHRGLLEQATLDDAFVDALVELVVAGVASR
jgi:AcrR family transcriptional regulator